VKNQQKKKKRGGGGGKLQKDITKIINDNEYVDTKNTASYF